MFFLFFCVYLYVNKITKNQNIHSMTQILHNSFRPAERLSGTNSFGKAVVASCNNAIKGGEWYDAPGVEREVGVMRYRF